jgi:hypothetical protein
MLCGRTVVSARLSAIVSAVGPSEDALSMELASLRNWGLLSRMCEAITFSQILRLNFSVERVFDC